MGCRLSSSLQARPCLPDPWSFLWGKPITSRLLSLPAGIHFRKLTLTWYHEEDLSLTMGLVEECSHTLESLDINHTVRCASIWYLRPNIQLNSVVKLGSASIDLSKAARLKDVAFRAKSQSVKWITMALHTITPEHRDLRQISIYVHLDSTTTRVGANIRQTIGEQTSGQWLNLDRLLARFWESRSIRPKVIWMAPKVGKRAMRNCIGCLLPVITMRGLIDLE